MSDNDLNVLNLFCGCGGFSKGFRDAGFNILLGVDFDDYALATYTYNFGNNKAINMDLFNINLDKLSRLLKEKKVDIIIGGTPCQGFSLTGPRKFDDPRNKLYLSFFKTVRKFKPKAFVIENVAGVGTLYNGAVKEDIIKKFSSLGYTVKSKLLLAADYGVPQMRKRLFFIGIDRSYGNFEFPSKLFKSEKKYISCGEAISDLPRLSGKNLGSEESDYSKKIRSAYQKSMRNKSKKLHNHVGTEHTDEVKEIIALVPEGGNFKDLPKGVGENRKFNEAWTRYHRKKPSKTIDTGHRNHFHYKYNRVPTVRENARLQSFPDTFIFKGTKTSQNKQVGNAVPPKLAFHIANKIKSILNKSRKINTIDLFSGCGGLSAGFYKQGNYKLSLSIDWDDKCCETLKHNLKNKWGDSDADKKVLNFDIQKTQNLLFGWDDKSIEKHYFSEKGISRVVDEYGKVQIIIGGPPCQAYSVAGRVQDKNRMRDDYRNYLFESYIKVVGYFEPLFFIFENVPGMLSAKPGGISVTQRIRKTFKEQGYEITDDIKSNSVFNTAHFGVPQKRYRVILLGVNKKVFKKKTKEILEKFYKEIMPSLRSEKIISLQDAIGDLPKFLPSKKDSGQSHLPKNSKVLNHYPRFHNKRDISIFQELALDALRKNPKYNNSDTLRKLYTEKTGKTSSLHKYHVLKWDKPSTTIVSHLKKDGLRHIHPDPSQGRSITPREAARIQSFDDDYEFLGSQSDQYRMIGDAVPLLFSEALAKGVQKLFDIYCESETLKSK